jgi:hypothetical protein
MTEIRWKEPVLESNGHPGWRMDALGLVIWSTQEQDSPESFFVGERDSASLQAEIYHGTGRVQSSCPFHIGTDDQSKEKGVYPGSQNDNDKSDDAGLLASNILDTHHRKHVSTSHQVIASGSITDSRE